MTGLDGQVGRGRVLGFSCSVLAQIRDALAELLIEMRRKTNTLGWMEGAPVCVYMCTSMQPVFIRASLLLLKRRLKSRFGFGINAPCWPNPFLAGH